MLLYRFSKGYSRCYGIADKFMNQHCPNQTKALYTYEELNKLEWNKDDIFIIGSDQVWNPSITGRLKYTFTFSFLGNNYKMYSYASSFGFIKEQIDRIDNKMIDAIRSFKKVSVREKFGVEFLAQKGIQATEVIDPTLLLDNYNHLIDNKTERRNELLLLTLSNKKEMNDFADSISQKTGLKIRKHFGYLQPQRSDNMKFLSVEEWMKAIASSELIITDSFHATIFSILFKKQFFVFLSEPNKVYRIKNLLEKLGIEGHIADKNTDIELNNIIQYDEVDKKLENYRHESVEFLKSILDEGSNL
jgi:polysaccharide pyruvyl transferase WcaK-like protein